MFAKACELGLEGIVSKRLDGLYWSGRCRNWLKIKTPAFPRNPVLMTCCHVVHSPVHASDSQSMKRSAMRAFAQPGQRWLGRALLFSSGGWRTARPTLEGMIERGRPLVAQEPRDLRQCKTWLFEILEREATAQLVNDRREGRAFAR